MTNLLIVGVIVLIAFVSFYVIYSLAKSLVKGLIYTFFVVTAIIIGVSIYIFGLAEIVSKVRMFLRI